MSQIVQLETGYEPKESELSRAEDEREWLKKLAEDVLSDERFKKAFTLMVDLYTVLSVVAKLPQSSHPEHNVYVDGCWQPDRTWLIRDLRK